jgi:hypothetical protein
VTLQTRYSTLPRLGTYVLVAFAALLLAACNTNKQHPDIKDGVDTAMTRNDLGVVKVSQNRDKGVLTLT